MRFFLFVLIALGGLLLQGTVMSQISADVLKPDLAFLVVVYLGLHMANTEGTVSTFAIGYLADAFSVQPDGTFLLLYFGAFYLATGASRVFYFRGTGFPAAMVFSLSLLYSFAIAWMTVRAAADAEGSSLFSWGFLFAFSIANVLFSFPLFRLCRLVDSDHNLRTGNRAIL
jgi:rod shape-determining protein MreD